MFHSLFRIKQNIIQHWKRTSNMKCYVIMVTGPIKSKIGKKSLWKKSRKLEKKTKFLQGESSLLRVYTLKYTHKLGHNHSWIGPGGVFAKQYCSIRANLAQKVDFSKTKFCPDICPVRPFSERRVFIFVIPNRGVYTNLSEKSYPPKLFCSLDERV